MRRPLFLLLLLSTAASGASIKSTPDEWVDRFIPETKPKLDLPAYADAYDRALADVTAGKYRAALATLAGASDLEPDLVALLRARALAALGDFDQAVAALTHQPFSGETDVQLLLADLWLEHGEPAVAAKFARGVLAKEPDSIHAHLLVGQILEAQGQFPQAASEYKWFLDGQQSYLMKWQNDPGQFESAQDLCDIATAIDRWATLTLAYKDLQQLNDTVIGMYLRTFDVIDRGYIHGRVKAAEFAASRGDTKGAFEYITGALKLAPYNVEVLRAAGQLFVAQNQLPNASGIIAALREVNPESADALELEVATLVRSQQPVAARDRATLLVRQHPDDPTAIGYLAGLSYVLGDEKALAAGMEKADAIAPKDSTAQFAAGQVLAFATQRDAAEKMFKTVIQRTPWQTDARHALGDLYVNDGREAEARQVLEAAYHLDPYNVVTVNYLRLLDELAKYDKQETDHFIIYYNRDQDPIMADQLAPFFESTYADLVEIFKYEPKQKIIVQLYATDDEFSVRMAGVPGVENYGVSFGRVLATVAPRPGTHKGNFNWGRVLRHELVHTFNLLQTQFRCPRWLTEALAVWQEHVLFRFKEVPAEMYQRAMSDDLFTVHGLAMAFIKPEQPGDGEQAYTQGSWLVRYLELTYGRESILKLLNAYGEGKSDEAAFLAATGKPLKTVVQDWHAWMKQQIEPWGYDPATNEKVAALEEEGEAALKAKLFPQARTVWEQVLSLQPQDMKAHQRLAYVYLQKETADPEKAIEHLKWLHVLELSNNRIAKEIAKLYMQQDDLPDALAWAQQAVYVDTYDASAHELLAEVYDKMHRAQDAAAARQTVKQIELWEAQQKLQRDRKPEPAQ